MRDKAEILSGFPYNYGVSVEIGIVYSINRDNGTFVIKGMESGAIYRNVKLLLPVNSYQGVQNIATPHHKDTCLLLIRKNNMEKQVWILGFMILGDSSRGKEVYLGDQGWYLSEDMYVILHENGLFEIRYGNGMLIYDAQTGYRKNIFVRDETILNKLNFRRWYRDNDGTVGFTEVMHKTMEPLETSQKIKANCSRKFGKDCEDGLMKDVVIAFNFNKDIKFTYAKTYDRNDGWYISESTEGEGFHNRSRIKQDRYEHELVFGDIGYTVVVEKGHGIHITDKKGNAINIDGDGAIDYKSVFGTEVIATKDGNIKIKAGKNIYVSADKAVLTANSVIVGGKDGVKIDENGVTIGGEGGSPVPLGQALLGWLNSHIHTSSAPGSPTSPSIVPADPSILSKTTKIK